MIVPCTTRLLDYVEVEHGSIRAYRPSLHSLQEIPDCEIVEDGVLAEILHTEQPLGLWRKGRVRAANRVSRLFISVAIRRSLTNFWPYGGAEAVTTSS